MDRGAWWAIQFMDSQRVGHNWASEHWKQVLKSLRTSLVAQTVKCLSTMWETQVQSLVWEDPLEKEMAIYSSTIAWKIPWTEEPGRLQSMGLQRVGHDWATSLSLSVESQTGRIGLLSRIRTSWFSEWSKSEREKQTLCINSYMKFRKMIVMNLFSGQHGRHRHTEQTYRHGVGWEVDSREAEGGRNWKRSSEAYTLPSVKRIASGNLLCDAGSLNPVLCDNLQGWDGVEESSRERGCMYTCGWFMLMYGRNQHNIVKQLSSN